DNKVLHLSAGRLRFLRETLADRRYPSRPPAGGNAGCRGPPAGLSPFPAEVHPGRLPSQGVAVGQVAARAVRPVSLRGISAGVVGEGVQEGRIALVGLSVCPSHAVGPFSSGVAGQSRTKGGGCGPVVVVAAAVAKKGIGTPAGGIAGDRPEAAEQSEMAE